MLMCDNNNKCEYEYRWLEDVDYKKTHRHNDKKRKNIADNKFAFKRRKD